MGHRTLTLGLVFRALFLDSEAFDEVRDDDNPFIEGLFLLVLIGAVTAALYLERFVPDGLPWAHLDVYAWNDSDRAGRPAGGEALALRSAYAMLKARYGATA